MQTTRRFWAALPCGLLLLNGCGSDNAERACAPGMSIACVGAGNCMGHQVCDDDGSSFGACQCSALPADSGAPDSATDSSVSDASDTDGGAITDGAIDDAATDAAIDGGDRPSCSVTTQVGCATAERCAWVTLSSTTGVARCVPNGVVPVGGACTRGPDGVDTGYDNCARGGVCVNNKCSAVCDSSIAGSCNLDVCVRYTGLFDPDAEDSESPSAGVCVTSCDPVTQELRTGGTCGAGNGCFASAGGATCGQAPRTLTHGQAITGTPFLNACAPGHVPIPNAAGDGHLCATHCRPLATSIEMPAGVAGLSPDSCVDRGATSPAHDCVFLSHLPTYRDANLDNVGYCLDRTGRTWDDDALPETPAVAQPRCSAITSVDENNNGTPDNQELGCAP